jgi:hypothetical protein
MFKPMADSPPSAKSRRHQDDHADGEGPGVRPYQDGGQCPAEEAAAGSPAATGKLSICIAEDEDGDQAGKRSGLLIELPPSTPDAQGQAGDRDRPGEGADGRIDKPVRDVHCADMHGRLPRRYCLSTIALFAQIATCK